MLKVNLFRFKLLLINPLRARLLRPLRRSLLRIGLLRAQLRRVNPLRVNLPHVNLLNRQSNSKRLPKDNSRARQRHQCTTARRLHLKATM